MIDYFQLVGREVEVEADGMTYRGKLIEMTEEEIQLESSNGWVSVRMERVSNVRPAEEA